MKGLLIDVTKCTGCGDCVDACQKYYKLRTEVPTDLASPDKLSSYRYSTILNGPKDSHIKKQCLHCLEPSCEAACLVGALKKTKLGPVAYDKDKCIGCRYCMLSCQYKIPRYDWDLALPYVQKCSFCYERQLKGEIPLCATVCPEKALMFDERENLIAEAQKRLAAEPKKYIQHIFGLNEGGGTSYIYISHTDISDIIGFSKKIADTSIPKQTSPVVMTTPFLAGSVFTFLTVSYFIINRKNKIKSQKKSETGLPQDNNEEGTNE